MKACIVNYNHDPANWWLDYGFEPEDVTLYDRSDDGVVRSFSAKLIKTPNLGNVDFDKLSYIIDNYNDLPEVFLWAKSNIFKYVEPDYLKNALQKAEFAPLLKQDHKTYSDRWGVVCRYNGEIYEERADSWFFNNPELSQQFRSWEEWCDYLFISKTQYIPFPPGGNFILTAERVRRYGKDFYVKMRETLDYASNPAEAHAAERSYYLLWK